MDYQQVIKEESFDYEIHFYHVYRRKVENKQYDFNKHLENDCKFDLPFLLNVMSTHMNVIAEHKGLSLNELMDSEELTKEAAIEFRDDMIEEIKKEYLRKLEEELKEAEEELRFAIEDEDYYEKRKYIGEENDIGGVVGEEERVSLIEGEKQKQRKYSQQVEDLKQAIKSIQTSTLELSL